MFSRSQSCSCRFLIVVLFWVAFCRPAVSETAAGQAAPTPTPTPVPTPSLDPTTIPKYVDPLPIPLAMPLTNQLLCDNKWPKSYIDYYEIAVRQFTQQILPASGFHGIPGQAFPKTDVWSYGSVNDPASFVYPAFSIEALVNKPVRVKWINQLVDSRGNFRPHLLPVDQTIHWANPNGMMPDMHGEDPTPYRGPVPLVTHLHGGHTMEESDGYPEAWFLPQARNIPDDYFRVGSKYEEFKQEFQDKYGPTWTPGSATYQYTNDQRATTLWYHDHALGLTRVNIYAGPAGFYLLRGGSGDLPPGVLPEPAPRRDDPPGKVYHEIPMVIQDRSFNMDGSLFFPNSRQFFDGIASPYAGELPLGDIAPIANPEFFGNTIVVNGKTWPNLNVEPRRYRFRFLDACNARTVILKMVAGDPASLPVRNGPPALPFWQIGADGGFLPAPVKLNTLLISLAERADVIVDFSGFSPGQKLYLINLGPDDPYNGENEPDELANPQTTGQVMQFTVVPLASKDASTPPDQLRLPARMPLGPADRSRQVSLNEVEIFGQDTGGNFIFGPRVTILGVLGKTGLPLPLFWSDSITESPRLNDTEIWEIYNFTEDGHPIHLHQVQFEILSRTPMGDPICGPSTRPPEPWETGTKDTVISYPGEVTRIKAHFDLPGLFVWHCHIIDHEDNEMMRPYRVVTFRPRK